MTELNFILIEDPMALKPILEERRPRSCFVYNQMLSSAGFKDDVKFYSVGEKIDSETWIVVDYIRKDEGHNFTISAPLSIINGEKQIPPEVKQCFSSGGSVLNWDDGMVFISLEKSVSAMILDISINIKRNLTVAHPCNLYFMETADAKNLSISWKPEIEMQKLSEKEAKFIASNWKYSTDSSGEVFRKCIEANPSTGVFVDGKCVAGVIVSGNGLVASLYTLKEYRGRGYAKLIMQYMYKECAKNGYIPCSTAEVKNMSSTALQYKLCGKVGWEVDYIEIKKLDID